MKNKLFLTFTLLIASYSSFAQSRVLTDEEINGSGVKQLTYLEKQNCDQVDKLFRKDLANKTLFLLHQGGEAPIVYTSDKAFENKYAIYYYDFGCIAPDHECLKRYNYLVFEYLTTTYGKKWSREIRKDIIGLKDWRKK